MKVKVKLADRIYVVDVGDLNSNPVVAMVDGERFEVWLEDIEAADQQPVAESHQMTATRESRKLGVEDTSPTSQSEVTAPIPGIIDEICVQPGDEVEMGQALCVIEAMKMKNTIRAAKPGVVGVVKVSVGQHVRHGDVLLAFEQEGAT